MPNTIKYSTGSESLALKKGNFYIGTGDVPKGPTSSTGYWNGISPPAGGYTVYINKDSNGPAIYVASNDSELIAGTNEIAKTNYTTAAECLTYFASQTDKMVTNIDYPSIVTDGLILNLDAGFTPSYPRNNTTWYDVSRTNTNTSIPSSNTYSNGTMNYVYNGSNVGPLTEANSYDNTMECWFYIPSGGSYQGCCDTLFGTYWFRTFIIGSSLFTMIGFWNGTTYTYQHPAFTISYDAWHCAVGVRRDNRYIIWIDGNEVYNTDFGSGMSLYDAVGYWTISTSNHPDIKVSSSRVYNRGLSNSEILQNYNAGLTRLNFCKTCKEIIDTYPQTAGYDGLYWVYPEGTNNTPYQVYCDMTTDGGGWMLISRSHPTTWDSNVNWGWKGGSMGSITDFSQAYQLGWGQIWDENSSFTSYIFGNQRTNVDNSWGPFIYKVSSIDYSTFFGSDSLQYYVNSVIKSDTSVYGADWFPGMQQAVGFTSTGTNNNIYFMRDCCGFAGYGGTPTSMSTVYCGANFYYSGAWCGGSTTTGGVYDNNVYVSNGLTFGGTNQYMIMVR